jgi:hypothetical protein
MRAIPVTDRARTNNPSIVAPRLQASYCVVTRTLAMCACHADHFRPLQNVVAEARQ